MNQLTIDTVLTEWSNEFHATLIKNNSLFIALFNLDGELLFASNSMANFLLPVPKNSLINPTFEKICSFNSSEILIFEGFLTITTNLNLNTSLWSQIYRKQNQLLIIGTPDATQLIEQNTTMHELNREIGNLQRELIKEKKTLEQTLQLLNKTNLELKELNHSKDLFISILAHDLRNPFSAILGTIAMLIKNLRNYDLAKTETYLNYLNLSAQHTYKMLEDILLWIKAQSDKVLFEPQLYSINTICKK
ncbi:MAG TPA: hypothetical protein DCQ31_04790, partial [Bacteroidales bacterium]|nr:hypothetical protein [Bacteroidales bacterium]